MFFSYFLTENWILQPWKELHQVSREGSNEITGHLPGPSAHGAPVGLWWPGLSGSPSLSVPPTVTAHNGSSAEHPFLELLSWQELRLQVLGSKSEGCRICPLVHYGACFQTLLLIGGQRHVGVFSQRLVLYWLVRSSIGLAAIGQEAGTGRGCECCLTRVWKRQSNITWLTTTSGTVWDRFITIQGPCHVVCEDEMMIIMRLKTEITWIIF